MKDQRIAARGRLIAVVSSAVLRRIAFLRTKQKRIIAAFTERSEEQTVERLRTRLKN